MTLKRTIENAIGDAFDNILGPGELLENITLRFFDAMGTYDVEDDTQATTVTNVTVTNVLAAKPTTDDQRQQNVLGTDVKLVIPGRKISRIPQADTDKVIRNGTEEWDIRKVVGVPGNGVVVCYVFRT